MFTQCLLHNLALVPRFCNILTTVLQYSKYAGTALPACFLSPGTGSSLLPGASILIGPCVSPPLRPAVPSHQFSEPSYAGLEEDDLVTAYVVRGGDVTLTSSVRCYTRQGTAEAGVDFEERPDTNASLVHFAPGGLDDEKRCDARNVTSV